MNHLFTRRLVTALTLGLTVLIAHGDDKKSSYMNVSTEKKYVVGWTKGRYVTRNGKLIYIPGVPKFETRKTGTEMSIGSISVTEHGISLSIDLKKVHRTDRLVTDKGVEISLMTAKFHTLNGKRYKLLGTSDGRAYFKESKGKGVVSSPLAGHEAPPSEETSDKKKATKTSSEETIDK